MMSVILEESQKEQDIDVLVAVKKYWKKELKNCMEEFEALREYMSQCYLNIMDATKKLDEKKKNLRRIEKKMVLQTNHLQTIRSVEDLKKYPSTKEGKNYRILNPQLNILLAVNDNSGIYIASRHCAWSVIVLNEDKLTAEYFWYRNNRIQRMSKKYASDELIFTTKELIQQLRPLKKEILQEVRKWLKKKK